MVSLLQVWPAITTKYSLGSIRNVFKYWRMFFLYAVLILNGFSLWSSKWNTLFPRKRPQWHDHNISGQITVDHLVNSTSSMFKRLRMWGDGGDPLVCTTLGQACSYGQETMGFRFAGQFPTVTTTILWGHSFTETLSFKRTKSLIWFQMVKRLESPGVQLKDTPEPTEAAHSPSLGCCSFWCKCFNRLLPPQNHWALQRFVLSSINCQSWSSQRTSNKHLNYNQPE